MIRPAPTLLIVDDEPLNLEIIAEYLDGSHYVLEQFTSGKEALQRLFEFPDRFDAVLLDRMMPDIDGIEVLKIIKKEAQFQLLPVIMQTAATSPEQIAEGLQYGAYYYLPKPYEQAILLAVIETALRDRITRQSIQNELNAANETLKLLDYCEFSFKTTREAKMLGSLLAQLCPVPQTACLGLTELLLNAVEHGNLAITYDEKTVLISENRLEQEIEERLASKEYCHRQVKIQFTKHNNELIFNIEDEGAGFDWRNYIELDMKRLLHNHGRGIAMSKNLSFSSLRYLGKGNRIEAAIYL